MPGWRTIILALSTALLLPVAVGAEAATLTLLFTNNGEPLADPAFGKYYIYEPGKRESYVAWGYSDQPVRLPDGAYDVVALYRNDAIREERVLEDVELIGEMELRIAFNIRPARLTLQVTSDGRPVDPGTARYRLFPAGRRDEPAAARRPGESATVRAGRYDIEVSYRSLEGLQSRWLEAYDLEGQREETVEMGASAARLTVTVLDAGRELPEGAARWRIYRTGDRRESLGERDSGESLILEPGRYDIGVFYNHGGSRGQRWLEGLDVSGDVRRQVDVGRETVPLRVRVRHLGAALPDAWFEVFAAGSRVGSLAAGSSGSEVQVEPGTYDIRCTARDGGIRAEQWLRGQRVSGRTELSAEMEYASASLRVRPREDDSGPGPRPNILLLVDSSFEMAGRLGVRSRLEQVAAVLSESLQGMSPGAANVGLRVFGIMPPSRRDCRDSTLLLPVAPLDGAALSRALDLLRPSGHSPIAYSLERAAADLPPDGENALVLLSASPDTCGGDVCGTASALLRSGLLSRAWVIGLGVSLAERRGLDCAGDYRGVGSAAELKEAVREIFRALLRGEPGTVNVFKPRGGPWVVGGFLGERLELSPGAYDVQIRTEGRTYVWEDLQISGAVEARAGRRPPRGR